MSANFYIKKITAQNLQYKTSKVINMYHNKNVFFLQTHLANLTAYNYCKIPLLHLKKVNDKNKKGQK